MSDKYIVKSGDTLSKIAKEHHTTVEEIARDNNIGNPDRILPGQKLILHPKAKIKIVDAVAEPIKQLECKVTYNGQTHSCFTDEKGNLPELKTRPNDRVKVEVKRMEGGYKTVAEFLMGKRTKDVVLKSPKIRFDSYTNIDHTRNPKMAPKNDGSLSDNEMQLTKKTTVVYNPQGVPVAKVQGKRKPLIWYKKVEELYGKQKAELFALKVIEVSNELGFDPNDLMACIALETGKSFSPSQTTTASSATGLIQFMKNTAHDLGTTTAKLAAMTHVQQMEYVKKYFIMVSKFVKTPTNKWKLVDIYLSIFAPAYIPRSMNSIVYTGIQAAKNPYHDKNSDGIIYKFEIASNIQKYYEKGIPYKG